MIRLVSRTRTEMFGRVEGAIVDAGIPLAALYGSWAFGDYHLDERGLSTFSDLDLLIPAESPSREELAALNSLLAQIIPLRVTVRHHDDLGADIDIMSDRWITLAGYASSFAKGEHLMRRGYREYVQAKTLLMLLRDGRGIRYAAVAQRIGSDAARNALDLKTGAAVEWRNESYLPGLIAAIDEPFRTVFSLAAHRDTVSSEALDLVESGLDGVSDRMPTTLLQHTVSKLAEARKMTS